VRRSGRSMNRQVKDRQTEINKLIIRKNTDVYIITTTTTITITRKPSLEVAPTTLAQRTRQITN